MSEEGYTQGRFCFLFWMKRTQTHQILEDRDTESGVFIFKLTDQRECTLNLYMHTVLNMSNLATDASSPPPEYPPNLLPTDSGKHKGGQNHRTDHTFRQEAPDRLRSSCD